jgi:hypothetical protein
MVNCRTPSILSPVLWRSLCLTFLLIVGSPVALAQNSSGEVVVVTGSVKSFDMQWRERFLQKGDAVVPGDRIVTADNSLIQLRMSDGGFLSVRSGTEMRIDQFVFDEKNQKNSSFLVSLIKGGFRSITGLIGKTNPDAYQIRTPVATIGIRGTDHEPMYIPPAAPNVETPNVPGVYDKVNEGETYLRNEHGVLSIKPGQVGFSAFKPEVAPQMLQRVPEFYKANVKVDGVDTKGRAGGKRDEKTGSAASSSLRPVILPVGGSMELRGAPQVTPPTPTLVPSTIVREMPLGVTPTISPAVISPMPSPVQIAPSTTLTPVVGIQPLIR